MKQKSTQMWRNLTESSMIHHVVIVLFIDNLYLCTHHIILPVTTLSLSQVGYFFIEFCLVWSAYSSSDFPSRQFYESNYKNSFIIREINLKIHRRYHRPKRLRLPSYIIRTYTLGSFNVCNMYTRTELDTVVSRGQSKNDNCCFNMIHLFTISR